MFVGGGRGVSVGMVVHVADGIGVSVGGKI